jgi:uncharacterized membrane protein
MLIVWPRQPLSDFILADKIPRAYFLIFSVTLIIYSYINLCCGCGDMIQRGYHIIKYPTDKSTYEKEIEFFRYGLVEFILHTVVLLLPFLPLMILAASVSAVAFMPFMKAVTILFTVSLLCRMFGFIVYLFWGRLSTIGYLVARAFMIVFIFGTFIFAPFINPIRHLYLLNDRPTVIGLPFALYMMIVIFAILLLIGVNHRLVRRTNVRVNEDE